MIRKRLFQGGNRIDDGFRLRSADISRLEGLSDAVIGFAITLLIVSLEVPRTFDDLLTAVQGFPAFAITFALVMVIWYEHDRFFRRYGLTGGRITVLNAILLFLILFYVYPLKFLFGLSVNAWLGVTPEVVAASGVLELVIRPDQMPQLYRLFGIGWTAVFAIFTLFYHYALSQRTPLELNSLEVFLTRAAMVENSIAASVGMLAILLSFILPLYQIDLAGWVFLLMFPLQWVFKRWKTPRHVRLARRLKKS